MNGIDFQLSSTLKRNVSTTVSFESPPFGVSAPYKLCDVQLVHTSLVRVPAFHSNLEDILV